MSVLNGREQIQRCQTILPLAALNTETNVIFRIVFHSDEGVNQLGINIDDFVISGTLNTDANELNTIEIAPNPTRNLVKIFLKDITANAVEILT